MTDTANTQPAQQQSAAPAQQEAQQQSAPRDVNSFEDLMSNIREQNGEQGTPQQGQANPTVTRPATMNHAEPKPSDMSQTQLELMRTMLQQSQAQLQMAQQQVQQPQQQQAPQQPQLPPVGPRVMAMLNSEDEAERMQGTQLLMMQTAALTEQRVLQAVQAQMQQQQQTQAQQQQTLTRAAQIQNEFYSEHKDLDSDLLRPVVGTAYEMVCQENSIPMGTWNKQVMALVAAKVRGAVQPKVTQEYQAPATPPAQFNQTTRGPVSTGPMKIDDILAGDFNPQMS